MMEVAIYNLSRTDNYINQKTLYINGAYPCICLWSCLRSCCCSAKILFLSYIYGQISVNWNGTSIVTSMGLQPKCVHNAMNKYKTYNTVVACRFKFSN